jgi:hypothetical protein
VHFRAPRAFTYGRWSVTVEPNRVLYFVISLSVLTALLVVVGIIAVSAGM